MFLDLLDTTKTSENFYVKDVCKTNAVQGESMLYYLLLSGQTPTLTQTQIMDSNIIHNILKSKQNKEYFLKMLHTGKIKLALYTGNGSRSLLDYFKKSLMYGIDKETEFYNFSTIPFLEQYDSKTRGALNKTLIDALEHNSYSYKTDGVSAEHIDYISSIIENIQDVDRAVRGEFLVSNSYKKNIDDLFKTQCQGIIKANEDKEHPFVKLCGNMAQKDDYHNRRSIYYNYLEKMKDYYSSENIEKMKQVIDNCYNEAVASLIDEDGYNLNFSSEFVDLAQPIQQTGNLVKKEIIDIKPSKSDKYLTWETLSNIMLEVELIEKKKNLSRKEAFNEYKKRQSYKPIIAVAKYLGVSALTSFIPGVPDVVEIFSDIVSGSASDLVGEKFKKPSLKEITVSVKNGKNKKNIAQNAIEFISMTMK